MLFVQVNQDTRSAQIPQKHYGSNTCIMKTHQLTNLWVIHFTERESIFLTLCTCTPINRKSLFSIMDHVLLHFLFLYYTVCSSIMETLKYIIAFHKSWLGENLLAFLSILLYI